LLQGDIRKAKKEKQTNPEQRKKRSRVILSSFKKKKTQLMPIAINVKAYPTLRLLFGAMCRSAAFYSSRRGGQATAGSAAGDA
jgi:hypothetical protein